MKSALKAKKRDVNYPYLSRCTFAIYLSRKTAACACKVKALQFSEVRQRWALSFNLLIFLQGLTETAFFIFDCQLCCSLIRCFFLLLLLLFLVISPVPFRPVLTCPISHWTAAQLSSAQLSSAQLSSDQINLTQLSSGQLISTQLNSAQFSSI